MDLLGLAFCLAEDRPSGEVGLRLAILGLSRHCPDSTVYVYQPDLGTAFEQWVRQFPQVTLIRDRPPGAQSWNCKPQALIPLLERGHPEVVWLDSDILITRDCRFLISALDERTLLVAQEPASLLNQGTVVRTTGWNWGVGRRLSFTLNSSVLRVTKHHIPLLENWARSLADPRYIAAQALPLDQRPVHMMSDQDILNALLGAQRFARVPLRILKSGAEIIHLGGGLGYSVGERLSGIVKRKPTFLHATAGKPWLWLGGESYWSQRDFFGWHRRLLQEVSAYVAEARQYRDKVGLDTSWMSQRTVTGTVLRVAGLGHFALCGLPITAVATMLVAARKAIRLVVRSRDYLPSVPGGVE